VPILVKIDKECDRESAHRRMRRPEMYLRVTKKWIQVKSVTDEIGDS